MVDDLEMHRRRRFADYALERGCRAFGTIDAGAARSRPVEQAKQQMLILRWRAIPIANLRPRAASHNVRRLSNTGASIPQSLGASIACSACWIGSPSSRAPRQQRAAAVTSSPVS